MVDAARTVSNRDDLATIAQDGVRVKAGLDPFVVLIAMGSAQQLTCVAIKIDNAATTVVIFLPTEIKQIFDNGRRNTALLKSGLCVMGQGKYD